MNAVGGKSRDELSSSRVAGEFPAELIAGIPSRDDRSLSALFTAYFSSVYNLAYRILGDHTQAEDMTQDVFIKAYRGAHHFDVNRHPWPWLVRITYNACRDHWRSWAHRLERSTGPLADDAPHAGTSDPERDLIQSEDSRRVQEAILELPPDSRVVVLLHDFEGLSHEEIASIVGANTAAVRKRYSRALARLAVLLEGEA